MLNLHPACELIPEMNAEDYAALLASVKARGVREPVVLKDGLIVDGRHRARAAEEARVGYPTVQWSPAVHGDSVVDYVIDCNVNRRQLTTSQRAMIAKDALPFYESEAAERLKTRSKRNSQPGADLPQAGNPPLPPAVRAPRARDHAAAKVGVSGRLVQDAKAVELASPEVAAQVRKGELSLGAAKAKLRPPPPPPVVRKGPALDPAGRPVTDPLVIAALLDAPKLDDIRVRFHALKRELLDLAKEIVGSSLIPNTIEKDFHNIAEAIRFARPYTTCPYMPNCTRHNGCNACHGLRWVTKKVYDAAPPEVKG